jgi:predicted DNA-binding protein
MFEVPLSPEAIRVLREIAQKTGVTPEEFARRAILERMEDTEDALLADERLRTSEGSVSWEEVQTRLFGDAAEK